MSVPYARAHGRASSTSVTLYRVFDLDRVLLYVGISNRPITRFAQHAADKPWWTEAANVGLEHFPDRPSAEDAERHAIATEQPIYNVMHSPHPDGIDWWTVVEHRPEVEGLETEIDYIECYWGERPYLPCGTAIWFGYTDEHGHQLGMKHRLRTLVGPEVTPPAPNVIRHPSTYNIAARHLLERIDGAKLHHAEMACCR